MMPPENSGAEGFGPGAGVILARGLARRMGGGDKCLRALGGRPVLSHIVERVRPQVMGLVLNASGDPARFAGFGLPVVPDGIEGFVGPLAGVLAGLEWALANVARCRYVASFAGDAPFVPHDLVRRLVAAVAEEGADLACAASLGRAHPVFGLWRVDLAPALRQALVAEGVRKVDQWTKRFKLVEVEFPAQAFDPFFNANRPEDLAEAERLLQAGACAPAPDRPPDPYARFAVGVIVERRRLAGPWQQIAWRPVAVVPGGEAAEPWTPIEDSGERTRFFAGMGEIDLHPRECANYRANLLTAEPSVYVVLRPDAAAGPFGLRVQQVSVSPSEGEAYMVSGEDIVERVPMPGPIAEWLAAYVAAYHVEEEFRKRRRERYDPNRLGRQSREGGHDG